MLVQYYYRLKRFLVLSVATSILLCCTFILAGCCPYVYIKVLIGTIPPTGHAPGVDAIHICPTTPFTLGWYDVPKEFNQASVSTGNTVERASLPNGFRTIDPDTSKIYPQTTTKYTITATGDCSSSSYCTVYIVKEGDKNNGSARKVTFTETAAAYLPGVKWQTEYPEEEWDKNILVTSFKMVEFPKEYSDLNSLLWHIKKTDPDGQTHDFDIRFESESPWAGEDFTIVGTWELKPLGVPSSRPDYANFQLTMKCK